MVTIRNSEKGLCCVGFFPLVIWPKPYIRDCTVAGVRSATGSKVTATIPDSIAVIVNISLLHLNSGLTINIFDNWR